MIFAILTGFVIGYIIAIPPGPVGVTAMKLSLNQGKKHGTLLAAGNGVLDFTYCLLAVIAASAIRNSLETFSSDHPVILLLIQFAIVAGIFLFGIINLKHKKNDLAEMEEVKTTRFSRFFQDLANKGPFLLGIAVALTNIPNPTFFPSIVAAAGFGLSTGFFEDTFINSIFFALGFGLGNFSWLYTLVNIIVKFKDRLSPETLARIHKFAGITLIGFSTILGYRVVSVTEWHTILRLLFAF